MATITVIKVGLDLLTNRPFRNGDENDYLDERSFFKIQTRSLTNCEPLFEGLEPFHARSLPVFGHSQMSTHIKLIFCS
jgi:hypothetical protein